MDLPNTSWRLRLLRSESARSSLAAVVSVVLATPVVTIWLTREEQLRSHGLVVGCLMGWTVFAALHALVTVGLCRGRPVTDLVVSARRPDLPPPSPAEPGPGAAPSEAIPQSGTGRVIERAGEQIREGRRRWRRWSDRHNQAPSWSVQVSALALMMVAVILVNPELRSAQSVLFAALAMVAACWVNVVVMYAVHYARLSAKDDGLAFPGEPPEGLSDYLYFSLAVQSTFGTTDVEVRTRTLRRAVTAQGALAFLFNSVIIAMIVSLLLGVAA